MITFVPKLKTEITEFCRQWELKFTRFGHDSKGELAYGSLMKQLSQCFLEQELSDSLQNAWDIFKIISSILPSLHLKFLLPQESKLLQNFQI